MKVHFSDTVLYAAEVLQGDQPVHVLGYQNRAQGRVGLTSQLLSLLPGRHAGNAMILPFPALPGTMTPANVLPTDECSHFLQDMALAFRPKMRNASRSASWGRSAAPRIQVFSTGIYTVVLAQDPREIPAALHQVPKNSRPLLNDALFEAYANWYPQWTVALCCFNNRRARLADPMLWWYQPMFPDELFLPALDCHTGAVPDLNAAVDVDHVIAVGAPDLQGGIRIRYRDKLPPTTAPYVLDRLIGGTYKQSMPNGDFVCPVADVRQGVLRLARRRPDNGEVVAMPLGL